MASAANAGSGAVHGRGRLRHYDASRAAVDAHLWYRYARL